MSIALRSLALLLVLAGLAFAATGEVVADARAAGDQGGAAASFLVRLIPFLIAARLAWNAAAGRKVRWVLVAVLALWVVAYAVQRGQDGPARASAAASLPMARG